tara:strand:- start:5024 stop:5818 length:795 start_codon:yes stop_codon:yes gene_type:complete
MKDPTQTTAIRKAWESQLKRRFRRLRREVDILFTGSNMPLDSNYVEFFDTWFAKEIAFLFAGSWVARYVEQSYLHGMLLSRIATMITAVDRDTIALLKSQAVTETTAALDAMKAQASERISKGIMDSKSKNELSAEVNNRIDKIGQTRTLLVSHTMPVYSSDAAEINAAIALGGDTKLLWITRQDEKVRTTHALINRKLFTPKVAMNLIGDPNCRCRVKPVQADPSKLKGYSEIRRKGINISAEAQIEQRLFEVSKTQALGFFD